MARPCASDRGHRQIVGPHLPATTRRPARRKPAATQADSNPVDRANTDNGGIVEPSAIHERGQIRAVSRAQATTHAQPPRLSPKPLQVLSRWCGDSRNQPLFLDTMERGQLRLGDDDRRPESGSALTDRTSYLSVKIARSRHPDRYCSGESDKSAVDPCRSPGQRRSAARWT